MNPNRGLFLQAKAVGRLFGLTIALGFFNGLLVVLQAHLLSQTISLVFLFNQTLQDVGKFGLVLSCVVIFRAVLVYFMEIFASQTAIRVKSNLREMLLDKMLKSPFSVHQQGQTGEKASVFIQQVEALDAYFSQYLPQLALAVLVPAAIFVTIFPRDLLSGIILLLTAPLIPIFMFLIGKTVERATHRQLTALKRLSGFFLDTLQGLTTLKLLNQSQKQVFRIQSSSENYRKATLLVLQLTFLSALVLELTGTLSTALIAVEIGLRLLYGKMEFQSALFILVLAPDFYLPLRMLGQRFHAGQAGKTAAIAIFKVLSDSTEEENAGGVMTDAIQPNSADLRLDGPRNFGSGEKYQVSFENVHFTYPGESDPALQGITFNLSSMQNVALVGPSGGGKTTIIRLLMRFIDPSHGIIKFCDTDIRSIDLHLWRSWISWVPQKPFLFHDSLEANLMIGMPTATKQEIRHAAKLAHVDDFAKSLPNGYQTILGERGARLSSGQAQRIALARAFLRNAPLIIMDEPTSHLDPLQESLFRASFEKLCENKTILTVAHKLSTIMSSNLILMIENGRITESGSHASLMAERGRYYHLVQVFREEE